VLCDFITEGHFARHNPSHARTLCRTACRISGIVSFQLSGLLEIPSVEAGLQTVGWLAPGIRADRAAEDAAQRDVEVIPIGRYASRRFRRQGLLLGFAAVDARELRRGSRKLARSLEACRR